MHSIFIVPSFWLYCAGTCQPILCQDIWLHWSYYTQWFADTWSRYYYYTSSKTWFIQFHPVYVWETCGYQDWNTAYKILSMYHMIILLVFFVNLSHRGWENILKYQNTMIIISKNIIPWHTNLPNASSIKLLAMKQWIEISHLIVTDS